MATQGEAIWRPPADWRESTVAGRYLTWLDRGFAGYDELHSWSVTDLEGFWASLWDWFGIRPHVPCLARARCRAPSGSRARG